MVLLKFFVGCAVFMASAFFIFYGVVSVLWSVPPYHGPVSDHFDGKHFHNLEGPQRHGGLGRFLAMRLRRRLSSTPPEAPWPDWIDGPPGASPLRQVLAPGLRLTFINHATTLIQMDGLNILTDPIWSERASPVAWAGPARHRAPGVRFEDLPPIHVVLISHNHYDHMDLPTLRRLQKEHHPRFIVALANSAFLKTKGISGITELDWWGQAALAPHLQIISVPAKHFSARSVSDRNNALWGGYVLQAPGGSVYFAGDTGYGAHYTEIARRYGPIRLALLPIGAYRPRWFMEPVHMSPDDAVLAHRDLKASMSVGIHFGTFKLSEEGISDPVNDLKHALDHQNPPLPPFVTLREGESLNIPSPR